MNNTAILGGVAYFLHDSSLIIVDSIFDNNWGMLYPLFYFGNSKNSISSCTLCDINSNTIPADARTQLRERLVGYSTLQELVDTYNSKQNDGAAIKLENGYFSIDTTKSINQNYLISAVSDSIVHIHTLEYFSPDEISTVVNCEGSFLNISDTALRSLQMSEGKIGLKF